MKLFNDKFLLILLFGIFFIPHTIFAAGFFLDTPRGDIHVGDSFIVEAFFSTDGEVVNALGGKILFPADLLALTEVRDGNSIVNFWSEKPKVGQNPLIFSGITPGGYQGSYGSLFTLVFTAKKLGSGSINLNELQALKNDGLGTTLSVYTSPENFSIVDGKAGALNKLVQKKDTEPPESFTPVVANNPEMFDGQYFLVFATADKGVGLKGFQVKETKNNIFTFFSKWEDGESPFVLHDQNLESFIYVKAVDQMGNTRIVKVFPTNPPNWYESYENWFIIILLVVGTFIFVSTLWSKNKKNLFRKNSR